MISEDDKTQNMNRRDDITKNFLDPQIENNNEEVDFQVLFETLDNIFNEEIEEETQRHEPKKSYQINEPNFIRIISKLYENTSWSQMNQINEVRPEACMDCVSIKCVHVNTENTRLNVEQVLEKALEKCTHKVSEDWLFDDICSKCIMISCETVTFSEQSELHILWDETDLIQYYNWINKIDSDSSLVN